MRNFYLFRHGLATHSLDGYGDKIITAAILPEAILPIQRMGTYLCDIPSDFNVSSEFLRCRQTTQIVSDITKKQFLFDSRLNEYYNESFDEFSTRVKSFLQEIEQKNYQDILVCTHGAVIAALKRLILANHLEVSQLNDFPKTGMLLCIKNKNIEEIDFNL